MMKRTSIKKLTIDAQTIKSLSRGRSEGAPETAGCRESAHCSDGCHRTGGYTACGGDCVQFL